MPVAETPAPPDPSSSAEAAAHRLELRFLRPTELREEFTPLSLPEEVVIDREGVDGDLVDHLHVELDLGLGAGEYDLPVTDTEPLRVAVEQGTRCEAWISASRGLDPELGRTLITAAELTFSPAITLHNVWPVLSRLPTLFEDHDIAGLRSQLDRWAHTPTADSARVFAQSLLQQVEGHVEAVATDERVADRIAEVRAAVKEGATRLWSELKTGAGLLREELKHRAERLPLIRLRHVSARPVKRRDGWRLQLRFSGEFGYPGALMTPFGDVVLPTTILPAPAAVLADLMSDHPLATAALRRDRIPVRPVARALARLPRDLRGRLEVQVQPPTTAVRVPTPNLGELNVELTLPPNTQVRTHFEGRFEDERVEVQLSGLEVGTHAARVRADATVDVRARRTAEPELSVMETLVEAGFDERWPDEQLTLSGAVTLDEESALESVGVLTSVHHPLTDEGSGLRLEIRRLAVTGALALDTDKPAETSVVDAVDLAYAAQIELPEGSQIEDGVMRLSPQLRHGHLEGRVTRTEEGGAAVQVDGRAGFELGGAIEIEAFPELDIDAGEVTLLGSGDVRFHGRARTGPITGRFVASEFEGSEAELRIHEATVQIGNRTVSLPPGSALSGRVREAHLASSGLGRGDFELSWDLQGQSPVLSTPEQKVEVFVPDLRQGKIGVLLSPVGGVTITGQPGGLYDAHFFNALVNPGAEAERWLEILDDDDAMDKVVGTLRVFSRDGARLLEKAREFAKRARTILDEESVSQPGDFIPGRTIARVLSKVLAEDDSLTDRLYPLVKQVTDGEGLDVAAVKQILMEHLPEHEYEYELDRALRLAARMLAPTEPVPPRRAEEVQPLVELEALAPSLAPHLSAQEMYDGLERGDSGTPEFARRVARVAPYLTLEQVEHLLSHARAEWPERERRRLVAVQAIKNRVHEIAESYGGLAFVPQAWAISFFLGEAVLERAPDDEVAVPEGAYPLGAGLLGPEEVAVLLQAGLASIWKGGPAQINQRLLLEYIRRQPPTFLREVLVEMAGRSPRALTGVLYAMLRLEQGRVREPLDVDEWIASTLGVPVPDLDDYMAGGRWARESHYEALSHTAELILAEADPYFAVRQHLQVVRHPVPAPIEPTTNHRKLAAAATKAIKEADAVARSAGLDFTGRGPAPEPKTQAIAAYEAAFAACRALLAAEPEAFQLDWFREFWGRNHEALVVLSVVRNVQQDVDNVRYWLKVRSGAEIPKAEQELVETVIDALYYRPEDREQLKADPLVRLLIDPPPGQYDFTIISAMGVITEGARGTELKDAYRRLELQRGVRTLRADTQTARSLDFNAARIEEAARRCTTPWGYIGYSQGCANGLVAESRLLGGTPEQQALAKRIVCRNLLFSAANGSAHGTCGDWKFLRAMIDLDRFLKHYQAVFSNKAIRLALDNISLLLDSRPFVHSLGGVDSLSHAGVAALARDGQWRGDVPTSIVRGIVETETMPEALEMLSNVLTKQIESSDHDTQVTIGEAVGHPVWVMSPMSRVLERCDMGCRIQRTHHWSPLKYATEFVTTPRDESQAIYDFPKDRHVFPWVEVNARFGVIRGQ